MRPEAARILARRERGRRCGGRAPAAGTSWPPSRAAASCEREAIPSFFRVGRAGPPHWPLPRRTASRPAQALSRRARRRPRLTRGHLLALVERCGELRARGDPELLVGVREVHLDGLL